eukprot:scaffold86870_cov48-Phaeocystis_antarctica.AAC.1
MARTPYGWQHGTWSSTSEGRGAVETSRPGPEKLGAVRQDPDLIGLLFGFIKRARYLLVLLNLAAALETERNKRRARTGNRLDDYLASPFSLASAWGAAHRGHLRNPPELLLNVELVLRMVFSSRASSLCVRGPYYEYNVRGYAVLPVVDIRSRASLSWRSLAISINKAKFNKSSSCRLMGYSCCRGSQSLLVVHTFVSPSPTWQRERLRTPSTTSAKSSGRSCRPTSRAQRISSSFSSGGRHSPRLRRPRGRYSYRPREHALGYPPRLSRRRQWGIS